MMLPKTRRTPPMMVYVGLQTRNGDNHVSDEVNGDNHDSQDNENRNPQIFDCE